MGANAFQYDVKLNLSADTKFAKAQIGELQKELQGISQLKLNFSSLDTLTKEINEASNAALKLQTNLESALNPKTGNLDLSKFFTQIDKSGNSIEGLAESLLKVGPQGSKAFMSLADSISRAEIPLTRTNKLVSGLWDNLKKTAGWQVSSSVIHGLMGGVQQAMGYAQALDKSLTDIRIVTGQSADQMARFAKEANTAAKKLSTTTTDYTNASLIYYQQGLSDAEVKKRSDITIKMANATGTNASKVSDQLTSIWNNFDNGTKSLEHYADVMTALGAATASSTDEIAKGVQKFAAISDTVGLSYEYATSALATITSTTRESADTVGNSLKTLFSRIQGLQLGETLDDGTTLNKYSTALAKVGISIKDSSNALKSMDKLLDEMGSKWNTLAEDQQMALAQTVGGVRQYTQIMTLMENWDFFKENLATAEAATGTLNRQAEIYAESWEAAKQRVRASWEGLWDNLIDSEGFKKIANIGSTIIDSISAAISGMGNSGGVLTTLAGTIGTVFKDQLSLGLEDVFYNVSAVLNPKGTQQKIIDRQKSVIQRMSDTIESSGGYISADGQEGKIRAQILDRQAAETIDRERHRKMIAQENLDIDAKYEEQLRLTRQKKIEAAAQIDAGDEQFKNALDENASTLRIYESDNSAERFIQKRLTIKNNNIESLIDKAGKQEEAVLQTYINHRTDAQVPQILKKRDETYQNAYIQAGIYANHELISSLGDQTINYSEMTKQWAEKTKIAEDNMSSALRQFTSGKGDLTEAERKANQSARDYTFNDLISDMRTTITKTVIESGTAIEPGDGAKTARKLAEQEIKFLEERLEKQNLIKGGDIVDPRERATVAAMAESSLKKIFAGIESYNEEIIGGALQTTGGRKSLRVGYEGFLQSLRGRSNLEEATMREAIIEQERRNLESNFASKASTVVNLGTGVVSTIGAIQGTKGALENFAQGNFGAGLAGIVSAGYNTMIGNRNYVEGIQNLGAIGKELQLKYDTRSYLQSQQNEVTEELKKINEKQSALSGTKETLDNQISQLENRADRTEQDDKRLKQLKQQRDKVQTELDSLDINNNQYNNRLSNLKTSIDALGGKSTGKAAMALGKVGKGLEIISENAQSFANMAQIFQVGFTIAQSVFEKEANKLKDNSEKANETAAQLNQIYENTKNNNAILLNNIASYREITNQLKDADLNRAQRSELLYEQNQSAMALIDKYNITDFSKSSSGEIIITESALRKAQSDTLAESQIAKYAAGMAKIEAQEIRAEYDKELLARNITGTGGLGTDIASGAIAAGGALLFGGSAATALTALLPTAIATALPIALPIIAGAAGLIGAFGDDIVRNTVIDQAVEKTKKTGSTSWLEEENGLLNEQLKENRHLIQQIADSQIAAEKLERINRENNAQDLLQNNAEAQLFEYNQSLVEGLIGIQASQQISKKPFINAQAAINYAEQNAAQLGLSGKDNLTFEKGETAGTLKYSYLENNQMQTGYISEQALATIKAAEEVKIKSDEYISDSIDIYNDLINTQQLSNEQALDIIEVIGSGDLSVINTDVEGKLSEYLQLAGIDSELINLLSQGGLSSVYMRMADEDTGADFRQTVQANADKLGLDLGTFLNNLNNIIINPDNARTVSDITEDINKYWGDDQNSIVNTLLEGTSSKTREAFLNGLQEFAGEINGETVDAVTTEAATEYVDKFYSVLSKAFVDGSGKIDTKKMSQALSQILNLTFSDWDIDSSIGQIITGLEGKLDQDSISILAEFLRAISGAEVFDMDTKLWDSAKLVGNLSQMKIGDKVDRGVFEELFNSGTIENVNDYITTDYAGNSRLIRSVDDIIIAEQQRQSEQAQNYINNFRNKTFSGITDDQLAVLSNMSWDQAATNSAVWEFMKGYAGEEDIDTLYQLAQVDLSQYRRNENGNIFEKRVGFDRQLTGEEAELIQEQFDQRDKAEKALNEIWDRTQSGALSLTTVDKDQLNLAMQGIVSTYKYYEDAIADETVQKAIQQGWYDAEQALLHYAAAYPELTAEINVYHRAIENGEDSLKAYQALEEKVLLADAATKVKNITGLKVTVQEISSVLDGIRKRSDKQDGVFGNYSYDTKSLTELATKIEVAASGYEQLNKNGKKWISTIEKMDDKNKDFSGNTMQAFEDMGLALSYILDLWELEGGTDSSTMGTILSGWNNIEGNDIKLLKSGNRAAEMSFREYAVRQMYGENLTRLYQDDVTGEQSQIGELSTQLKDLLLSEEIESGVDFRALSNQSIYETADQLYNEVYKATGSEELARAALAGVGVSYGGRGTISPQLLTQSSAVFSGAENAQSGNRAGSQIVTYRAISQSGQIKSGLMTDTNKGQAQVISQSAHEAALRFGGGENNPYKKALDAGQYVVASNESYNAAQKESSSQLQEGGSYTLIDGKLAKQVSTGGGGGYGGGGGAPAGPKEVSVKSAQEFMTRYKTIDQKRIVAEMQKTVELNKKDLLYGSARIGQLQKINGLLIKQQQLTSERIAEEMDYLEKDKKRMQEVLERHKVDLEFNSEGIITNYKQTVGKWAEEIASFYTDGKLSSSESEKQKELQKKIDDLNVVIGDYENSLNQLNTSINEYENMLYEHFNNQMEELRYKVQYKIELEQDDLSYISFFADAIKDSVGQAIDYIELMGLKTEELYDQLDIYNEGFEEIKTEMDNNPLHIYATNGIEGILTSDEVEIVRNYRDKMADIYSTLISTRKEVEEKVLQVFDDWHSKITKNINNVNRFTGVLLQFKDIINIVGSDVLGLSNTFIKTFEQQTIDQSKDNIEATKKQYESLTNMYKESQLNLENARASGDEDSIKHWEEVVDKIETEMNSAQDSMLSALNQTLTLISDQFTSAVTETVDIFNESIYGLEGLDGLIQDYEQIREQQDYIVEDYEKIYNLSKLNRNIQKTLDDTKIIAGKQKLIEFQEKINELNKNNVELSKYQLDYLNAEYQLRLAEIELENARSSKETVRLSKDSEGNWSYIYTQNESTIDEAEQKYEDALFSMQQMNRAYTEEMSLSMITIAQQMRDEIAALELNKNFMTPEAYREQLEKIQDKYQTQMQFREDELNKSIQNNAALYNEDWANYNRITGYKISATQDWIDSFGGTPLGELLGEDSQLSNFTTIINNLTNSMVNDLFEAATIYFDNTNKALESYGSSLSGFGNTVEDTTQSIITQSKEASSNVLTMANDMKQAFDIVADAAKNWQDEFADDIKLLIDSIGAQIKTINDLIEQTESLGEQNKGPTSLIGQAEASDLLNKETFNSKDLFGSWSFDEETGVTKHTYTNTKGEDKENIEQNLVEFNGELVNKINEVYRAWAEAWSGSAEKEAYKQELKLLFSDYMKFKNIISRIYDLTKIKLEEPEVKDAEQLATGGYTGEWGNSGKLAILHEKELVLNKNDTANFLDALTISKQLVEMIEMNARQSSLGLGEMHASTIQDTSQTIEQQVSITAEFPNATDHSEIEEAFDNLINMASQYAYRN